MTRTLRFLLLPTLLLTLAACAPKAVAPVTFYCETFKEQPHQTRTITMPMGSSLEVFLCGDPSTGYAWEDPEIAKPSVAEQTSHDVDNSGNRPELVGAPAVDHWTFKAVGQGQTTIAFLYSQPGEGGEKGSWTLNLTVNVR